MCMDQQPAPYDERRCSLFFRQLLLAVEFLHHHHIIHRDIKPENILFFSDDVIKVADFGVSHIFDEEEQLTRTAGRETLPRGVMVTENVSGRRNACILCT